jgi:hypothetical protein
MRSRELAIIAELMEASAYADFWETAQTLPTLRPTAKVTYWQGTTIGRIGPIDDPHPMWELIFNRVIGLGVTQPTTEDVLTRIVAFYQEASTRFAVHLNPLAQPDQLPQWLEAQGMQVAVNLYKCYLDVDQLPSPIPSALRVEQISAEGRTDYARLAAPVKSLQPVLAGLVGRPGWYHYLAFDGAQAVACGSLYIQNEYGWLGWAFTVPAHRRQGAQTALLIQRIRDAALYGCRWLFTETGRGSPRQSKLFLSQYGSYWFSDGICVSNLRHLMRNRKVRSVRATRDLSAVVDGLGVGTAYCTD